MPLRLYNTLTRRLEEFTPARPDVVTFYSCGPTVYDDAHIGNFRSFLAADVLRRFIESPLCELRTEPGATRAGPRRVVHVMNITDVGHMTDDANADGGGEDKMQEAGRRITEAKKAGRLPPGAADTLDPADPYAIANFYAGRFLADARRLGLKVALEAANDPTLMPRATTKVAAMIKVVEKLLARGHAYAVGPAGRQTVYFDVRSFAPYGTLSGNSVEQLMAGKGGRVSEGNQSEKRHPADFLLWKADPAHLMRWPSPWGEGYPGWHIECTAMSAERLLDPEAEFDRAAHSNGGVGPALLAALGNPGAGPAVIDLHSGGEDNIFPHHECEIAQSCAALCADSSHGTFARLWFHARFLLVEGVKMSKSKGNFFTARDLFAKGVEPGALRLELIKTHYRSNANFTEQGLKDSQRMIERWRRFADEGARSPVDGPADTDVARLFATALMDDLNVAQAIAEINRWITRIEKPTKADAALMTTFDAVLGVLSLERAAEAQTDIGIFADGLAPDPRVIELLHERRQARAAKDFAMSDKIRDQLLAAGYAIKDVAGGKVEVRRA